jgi:hypothetical protein
VFLGQDGSPYLGFRDLRREATWLMIQQGAQPEDWTAGSAVASVGGPG